VHRAGSPAHVAAREKIAIAAAAWPLLEAEALRLRSLPTDSGTARIAAEILFGLRPRGDVFAGRRTL
jgi:hypothetical protein